MRRVALAAAAAVLVTGCGSTAQVRGSATTDGLGSGLDGGLAAPTSPAGQAIPGDTTGLPGGTDPGSQVGGPGAPVGGSAAPGAPTVRPTTPTGGTTSTVATKGRGWDAKTISIGIVTVEDIHQYAGSLGVNFDPGSGVADGNAIVADINKRGGLLGRRVVPVYKDNRTTDVAANPEAVAQAVCTHFTQDHQVIAVINLVASLDTPNFRSCMRKAKVPAIEFNGFDDSTTLRDFGPYLLTGWPSLDSIVPATLKRLKAQAYFTGWNTRTSAPSSTPVKVGLLQPDNAIGQRTAARLTRQLKAMGVTVGSTFLYTDSAASYGSQMSSAVLQFASAGVTHVISVPPVVAGMLIFQQSAEQQRYRPRYSITTNLAPQVLALNAPAGQLIGAIGIGWSPAFDVNAAQDPRSKGAAHCLEVLRKGGVTYSGNNQRFAEAAAYLLCDSMGFIVDGAARAGGLTPEAIFAGASTLGTSYPIAWSLRNALTATHPATGSARDLHFDSACTCFVYSGPQQRM